VLQDSLVSDSDDRRAHKRFNAEIAIKIKTGSTGSTAGSTRDVSEGGLSLVLDEPLEQGKRVEIRLPLGDDEGDGQAVTTAIVMWSEKRDSGDYAAGLRFDAPSKDHLIKLLAKAAQPKAGEDDEPPTLPGKSSSRPPKPAV